MLKRKRKYYCNLCGEITLRVSDKKWIKSYCEKMGKDARLQLVHKK